MARRTFTEETDPPPSIEVKEEAPMPPASPEITPEFPIGTYAADSRAAQIAAGELARGLQWFGWKTTIADGATAGVKQITIQKVR
jgi:hypothetical protein